MTGYGNAGVQAGTRTYSIDIRALNSRQLDLNLKIPALLRERENLIRMELMSVLERGKVDLNIQIKDLELSKNGIKAGLIQERYTLLNEIGRQWNVSPEKLFELAVTLPDSGHQVSEELRQEEWDTVLEAVRNAVAGLDNFRIQEGRGIHADLQARVRSILGFLSQLGSFESERIHQIRHRLVQRFTELGEASNLSQNRFEEELIYYLEKLDISEEKQRLDSHCAYFFACMDEPENSGRKLAFISQEMGREINTIGSKANHAEMQKLVVLMKDELEKIKEQLNNVL